MSEISPARNTHLNDPVMYPKAGLFEMSTCTSISRKAGTLRNWGQATGIVNRIAQAERKGVTLNGRVLLGTRPRNNYFDAPLQVGCTRKAIR